MSPTPEPTVPTSSHRDILRSSSIIGGASVINIVLGILRQKAAALILGPSGIGLIGLLQSFIATASSVAALGLGSSGTRQVADAAGRGDPQAVAAVRGALFWGTLALAVAGSVLVWSLKEVIARLVFDDPSLASAIGWLGLAVGLSVAGGSQVALLTGLRQIGDVARISVISALAASVTGVAALWFFGADGIPLFILSAPLMAFLTAQFFIARLPSAQEKISSLSSVVSQWRSMVRIGTSIMLGGLIGSAGQLLVRTMVQRELGLADLGYFQAAATLSLTYLGFVLAAMATDYYPRLTSAFSDRQLANRLVNEQSEVALLLAGPVLLGMLGVAPWVLHLLYAADFTAASPVFRWLILADLLKIAGWPLGFLLLASGDGRAFMLTELLATTLLLLATWLLLPIAGVQAAGFAFLAAYGGYLPLVCWLGRRKSGFKWSRTVRLLLLSLGAAMAAVMVLALIHDTLALLGGVVLSLAFATWGYARLRPVLTDLVARRFSRAPPANQLD